MVCQICRRSICRRSIRPTCACHFVSVTCAPRVVFAHQTACGDISHSLRKGPSRKTGAWLPYRVRLVFTPLECPSGRTKQNERVVFMGIPKRSLQLRPERYIVYQVVSPTVKRSNQNQVWCANIGGYLVSDSIVVSDSYYTSPPAIVHCG